MTPIHPNGKLATVALSSTRCGCGHPDLDGHACSTNGSCGNGAHDFLSHPLPASSQAAPLRDAVLKAADGQYQNNNLTAARDFLALLEICDEHTPETLQTLGNIHFLLGAYESAATAFRQALAQRPEHAGLWLCLAHTCLQLGEPGDLEHCLEQALALEPGNLDALKLKADWHREQGRYQEAIAVYEKLAKHPNQVEIFLALAKCHFELGQQQATELALEHVLEIEPANQAARENLEAMRAARPVPRSNVFQAPTQTTSFPNGAETAPAGGKTVSPAPLSCEELRKFYSSGNDFFAGVEPPPLTELHLANSRIVPSRQQILPFLPKGGICAEVGTQTGDFAKQLLAILKPSKLHLFDLDFSSFDHGQFQSAVRDKLVELHEGDSSTCLAALPDRSFDFIYIDADHSYEGVTRDLAVAVRKLKEDGWLVCNDYTVYSPLEHLKYGVPRAVNEFCLQHDFEICFLGLHPWGYHDVALRKRISPHLGGAFLDAPDPNTFLPDVWEHLLKKYGIKSVLDVGAGAGWSTQRFLERGLNVLGVEGWSEALQRSQCRTHLVEHDYTRGPFVPATPFDLAWCSEFVEHLEERFVPNFMATFQACQFVCLTHAEVGQVGYHHVNCQTTDYWVAKMAEFGFEHVEEETAYLRSTDVQNAPWGRRTLTFFRRKEREIIAGPGAKPAGSPASEQRPERGQITPQPAEACDKPSAKSIIQEIGTGDEMFTGDKAHYFRVGESALHCIETALLATAKSKASVRRVLDLPCGHGRVLRFLKATFPQAELTACDLNRGAVDFCAKTFAAQPVYSQAAVTRISLRGKFDLIWCGSLLTHLRREACAEFVAMFQRLLEPGGLAIITLHGRWSERLLATGRYKYGLSDDSVNTVLKEYRESGFGYADYPGTCGYGISLCAPAFALGQLVSQPDLKLITYHEKGWDNHQDVVCLQKQPVSELLA